MDVKAHVTGVEAGVEAHVTGVEAEKTVGMSIAIVHGVGGGFCSLGFGGRKSTKGAKGRYKGTEAASLRLKVIRVKLKT